MRGPLTAALGFLTYGVTFIVVVAVFGFWWGVHAFTKPGPLAQATLVEIERGTSLNGIAATLYQSGAIANPALFVIAARIEGAQSDLKAGEYQIAAAASARDILNQMRAGKVFLRSVTIPEGRTSHEIVEILREVSDLSGEITKIPAEGALLPETYTYARDEDRKAVLARMQAEMIQTVAELWPLRAADLPVQDEAEALILASIIEKETGVADERRRVAGVFVNRLRKGMPLQTDPTVIYALTGGKPQSAGQGPLGRRLLKKDLETESPYNTYKNAGLPPGPIANPGRAAIEAALNPEAHDFLYFVADGTGGHVFAKTLEEHNKNVRKWRGIRQKSEE